MSAKSFAECANAFSLWTVNGPFLFLAKKEKWGVQPLLRRNGANL